MSELFDLVEMMRFVSSFAPRMKETPEPEALADFSVESASASGSDIRVLTINYLKSTENEVGAATEKTGSNRPRRASLAPPPGNH